jgi:hypothetical protein
MGCSKCGDLDERRLYALVDGRSLCLLCWKTAGRPWPRVIPTPIELQGREIAAPERLVARGEDDRQGRLTGPGSRPTFRS